MIKYSKLMGDDTQVKDLILKSFYEMDFVDYDTLSNHLNDLSLEAKIIKEIDGNCNFAPSDYDRIDKFIWQLIIEQKIFINLSVLHADNVKIPVIS